MALPVKTLSVYSNPWAATDHEGRPSGAFPHDVSLPGMAGRYVSATMQAIETQPQVTRTIGTMTEILNHAQHDRTWDFSDQAVTVPNSPYYMRAIKDGTLFPANEQTAQQAGLKLLSRAGYLKAARAAAKAEFDAMHGAGTFDSVNPPEPAKADK